jgi:hypothetical protein
MTLDKVLTPVLDGHPDVFDREWPLRVADIDRCGRLRLDAAARHIQDIGQDQLRELGFEDVHPLWIVRRTMIDLIKPIIFPDMLRLRRWCSATSTRWCEKRVRIDGGMMATTTFAKREPLAKLRAALGYRTMIADGLPSLANMQLGNRTWSFTRVDTPGCTRGEPISMFNRRM